MMINQDTLPVVTAEVTIYNPDWKVPGDVLFLYKQPRLVEVLTVNFNSGTMRVRFTDTNPEGKTKVRTEDISNDAFFIEYLIKSVK
jgi:hypothetical protein